MTAGTDARLPAARRALLVLVALLGLAWIWLSRAPAGPVEAADKVAPQVGFQAPDFTVEGLDGRPIRLSELRGNVVLVNFWATWCPPCRVEMPALQRIYDEERDRGFVVLGVDLQETPGQVRAFLEENGLDFPVGMDTTGAVTRRYRVAGIPSSFFVDARGTIRATYRGPMTEVLIRQKLEEARRP